MTRDDLFTTIHKAIRFGLFDLVTTAGSTDWSNPTSVSLFETRWRRMVDLLDAHTAHENHHIFRVLDPHDPAVTGPAGSQHDELDTWLDEIRAWISAVTMDPDPTRGLALYRELALFTAEYLRHIHDEETTVMARIWELCTDDEIATTRAAFMADTTPEVLDTSLRMMLPAIDPPARTQLLTGLAVTAPAPVVDRVLATARDVLDHVEADRLAALVGRVAA